MSDHGYVGFSHCFDCAKDQYARMVAENAELRANIQQLQETHRLAISMIADDRDRLLMAAKGISGAFPRRMQMAGWVSRLREAIGERDYER